VKVRLMNVLKVLGLFMVTLYAANVSAEMVYVPSFPTEKAHTETVSNDQPASAEQNKEA